MANARPPGGNTPSARIGLDLSSLQAAAQVARAAGQATAREINAMFAQVRTEQQLAMQQARQATSTLNAQNAQATAAARAESQVRIQQARAESIQQQQAARASAQAIIQEERRKTAAFNAEVRARAQAQRQAQSFGQGAATFAGAALGGPIGGIAGALAGGSPALVAGLVVGQGARAAVEASRTAAAYDRQRVAAVNLAGSQARLNELLAAYGQATGGAIDNAEALASVTKLMSVGFADNAQELEQFARAIRGISIAMGTNQDTVTQNLILELFSQRGMRLDQLGLQYDKVRQRADELRASDSALTQQMAYQQAVLEQAEQRFGALADSAAGQKTEVEQLEAAWANLRLEMGRQVQGPVGGGAGILRQGVEWLTGRLQAPENLMSAYEANWGIGQQPPWMASVQTAMNTRNTAPRFDDDQVAALRRRDEGFADIEREFRLARQDEIDSYNQQVASTERNYQKQRAREAEDFARQRLNAERKLGLSIIDVAQDSARQRVKWQADLERTIQEARADTAERVAELRADSAERVAKIEEDFAKDQEKRARDHGRRLRDAVANLDAVAIREEQRRFREENQEAKEAHEARVDDAQKSLQKAIDDQNKALAKQERQQTESLARRIAEQAENDRLRIEEMKAAFEAQKAQEDEERAIRLARQAVDHNDQLIELARQHADRIQQIKDHAQEERTQFTEESNKFLDAVGIHNQAWLDEQKALNDGVIARHEQLLDAERRALLLRNQPSVDRAFPGLYATPPPAAPSTSSPPFTPLPPYQPPRSSPSTLNVTIQGTGIQPNEAGRNWIISVFTDLIDEYLP